MTWFNKQNRLIQLLLLLIPVCNWIVEVTVRWGTWIQKKGIIRLIICIITIPCGMIFGWLDFIWVLFTKRLFLQ